MSAEEFKPKRGRPPQKSPEAAVKESAPVPGEVMAPESRREQLARLARERYEENRRREQASGAMDGDKLWTPEIDGFKRRWVMDIDRRIDAMLEKGYFIPTLDAFPELKGVLSNSDDGQQISQLVTAPNGQPTRQILMLCDEQIYHQRQIQQENRRQDVERQISRVDGKNGLGQERRSDGSAVMYDPTGGRSAFDI